jgi:hypothetical protein
MHLPSCLLQLLLTTALLGLSSSGRQLLAQTPKITSSGETMRIGATSVTGSGHSWQLVMTVQDDNANSSLPSSYRRWWHAQVSQLPSGAANTLQIELRNVGYTDIILPVWSRSTDGGQSFGKYERLPTGAVPTRSGSTHRFTLTVPAGVTDVRLAKFFPWTVSDCNQWITSIRSHRRVRRVATLGFTVQSRPIHMLELTNQSVPDPGKRRVWIHSGIHPGETTSYFVVQGLVEWLLSGRPEAELAMDQLIFNIVPMANPDGVALGNYRTNSRSVNLETEWTRPYLSTERELVALRNQIESYMGTPQAPGPNPIELLLNLHSTHGYTYPMHFRHVANASFDLQSNPRGVIPSVHAKETAWIQAFQKRSPLVASGTIASSTLSPPNRPFVEAMMHDRWSIDAQWLGSPKQREEVMAITFEGTYQRGPSSSRWSSADDYVQVGREMGLAIHDYFDLKSRSVVTSYGSKCGLQLQGQVLGSQPAFLDLTLQGLPMDPAWLVLGAQKANVPLPLGSCPLQSELLLLLGVGSLDAQGQARLSLPLPPVNSLRFFVQALSLHLSPAQNYLTASEGLDVLYTR